MMYPTLGSEVMFGSNYESYYHPDQFLLLRRQPRSSHWRAVDLLVGRGQTCRDPD